MRRIRSEPLTEYVPKYEMLPEPIALFRILRADVIDFPLGGGSGSTPSLGSICTIEADDYESLRRRTVQPDDVLGPSYELSAKCRD
jgi:hypothetical protein